MNEDLRGLVDPLAPIRRRQEWKLERLRARVEEMRRDLVEAQRQETNLRTALASASRELAGRNERQLDTALHEHSLRWLAQQHRLLRDSSAEVARLTGQQRDVSAQCLAAQRKLDAYDEHGRGLRQEYLRAQSMRAAAEADREWLARLKASHT